MPSASRARSIRGFFAALRLWAALMPWASLLLWASLLPAASELETLATLSGVAGREGEVLRYVQARVGGRQSVDNTGSLTATFGAGAPHTLIIAGLDEPGFVVSAVNAEGYLRLYRLADPEPHYRFDSFFRGQPVQILTRSGVRAGAVAARSVHFESGRSPGSAATELFVDVGAGSKRQAAAAGISILDPVVLEKRFARLGPAGKVTAPWISSRAGAAVLLKLAAAFAKNPPKGTVTLGFASAQYYYQAGLLRLLERVQAGRCILIQPGGGARPGIAPADERSGALAAELHDLAAARGYDFARPRAPSLSFGPFEGDDIWKDKPPIAVLTVGVENEGTPVEVVDTKLLHQVVQLLADLCGGTTGLAAEWMPAGGTHSVSAETKVGSKAGTNSGTKKRSSYPARHAGSSLRSIIAGLVAIAAVSGQESAVHDFIRQLLPPRLRERAGAGAAGNLIVRLGAEGPPAALFIAHSDEIGFKVRRLETNGRLALDPVGGLSSDLFAWHPVMLHTRNRPLAGIMTAAGTLDVGARSLGELESLGVRVADTLTARKQLRPLLGTRISASSLDDRIGCAVLLRALQQLANHPLVHSGRPVWVVFGVEEEIGLLGSASLARAVKPARVYAIDSFVTSDSPLEDRRIGYARLGDGFVIRAIDHSGLSAPSDIERVLGLARKHDIPAQVGVTAGGNDGSRFVRRGASNLPLSWPLRYAHTAAEVSDLADIEALEKIVRQLLETELRPPR